MLFSILFRTQSRLLTYIETGPWRFLELYASTCVISSAHEILSSSLYGLYVFLMSLYSVPEHHQLSFHHQTYETIHRRSKNVSRPLHPLLLERPAEPSHQQPSSPFLPSSAKIYHSVANPFTASYLQTRGQEDTCRCTLEYRVKYIWISVLQIPYSPRSCHCCPNRWSTHTLYD